MCPQPPTSAAARSATDTAVASTWAFPRPEGAATCGDDAARLVEHERGGLGAADVDAEPHGATSPRQQGEQGARHGGRSAEGLDVGAAARPAALDEHDVVPRRAQPLDDLGCRVRRRRSPGPPPRPARPAGTSASATVAPSAAGPHATPPTARLAVLSTWTNATGPGCRAASRARRVADAEGAGDGRGPSGMRRRR